MGGPGRSGTSFVAQNLESHIQVCSFRDFELKILCEFGGFVELYRSLVTNFSPNRAEESLKTFCHIFSYLRQENVFQPASLESFVSKVILDNLMLNLKKKILNNGIPQKLNELQFKNIMLNFLTDLSKTAYLKKPSSILFLEKTPHNLLQKEMINFLKSNSKFIHVYRNPMAIACSLVNQNWGPQNLESAITWVKNYFDCWFDVKNFYNDEKIFIFDISLEEIMIDPKKISLDICEYLKIDLNDQLFQEVDISLKDSWKLKLDKQSIKLLNNELDYIRKKLAFKN